MGTRSQPREPIQKTVLAIPIKLAKVANGDVLTNFIPGFAGTIKKVAFAVTDPVIAASKATTLNMEINTANMTGGVVAFTSANCTPLGAVVNGTAVTANNVFGATDSISVEASGVTAFTEGEGVLIVNVVLGVKEVIKNANSRKSACKSAARKCVCSLTI